MKPICFYHRADLDGKCSAAIVLRAIPEVELRGYNYGDDFPWEEVEGRDVIMVDCSLAPFDDMRRLSRECMQLTWIDHHKSAIDEAKAAADFFCRGKQEDGKAGCELAWEYYFPNEEMPDAVRLLGRYDVWDHDDPDTLPFQYGMRTRPNEPENVIWDVLFNDDTRTQMTPDVINDGATVLTYQRQQYEAMAGSRCFETHIPRHPEPDAFDVPGFIAIACNTGLVNSQLFDSVLDPERHDMMVTFQRTPKKQWTVSLYSTKDDVDCGAVAKAFGGGGHKGAAGFQCDELPFEV